MFVFPLPNTSTWNTIKTPKWETCNKNKTSSTAKGTKGQETEAALYLINLQLPNACPSLSRRCSTMQFFPTSRINKTPGLFFCFLLLSTQIMQKTKTEQPKSRHWNLLRQSMIDFYFALPLFIYFFKITQYYEVSQLLHMSPAKQQAPLRRHWCHLSHFKWRCFLTNSWAVM